MPTPIRWLVATAGLLLLAGAPAVWFVSQPADSLGELPDHLVVGSHEEGPADNAADDGGAHVTSHDPPIRPSKPTSVSLPAIGVESAPVTEVGLDANRAVEIPDDVREVGWYGKGPRPGEDGNAFLTSHVDARTQGRGILFDLRRSEPGDPVLVTHEDGSISEWTVVARERVRKGSYPMEQVFRFDGPPGLVIDTCGGAFANGSYEQIDIVYAVPVDETTARGPEPA